MADGSSSSSGSNTYSVNSLYVADLDLSVTDAQLYELFQEVAYVVSIRVCRDLATRKSLGYGYVNFINSKDAGHAMEVLNFTPLNGKPIRIMYSNRDRKARTNVNANIFVKNLDEIIDSKALHEMFSGFGNILSSKIATDESGKSKGYGFVQFDKEESSQEAINYLNDKLVNGKRVFVGHFLRREERENAIKEKSNNLYVKNLSESMTEEDLKKMFGEHGEITSAVVMRDGDGKSKCFGFVSFDNADGAAKAVEALNGKNFENKNLYVGKAQKKSERELELKGQLDPSGNRLAGKFQGLNLYVNNLDDSVDDDKFKELFSEFGTITSCKVLRDPKGISRGSGFVAFSTPEEASYAFIEMNGKMVVSKPLYVTLAQSKEERRARLEAEFLQMQSVSMALPTAPCVPMYTPGAPGLGQQSFHGQATPVIIPPQMLPRGEVLGNQRNPALASAFANVTPHEQRAIFGENPYDWRLIR